MIRRLKCWLGFHDMPGPAKETPEGFFYCRGRCGTYWRWEQGKPRYGYWATFGKLRPFMVKEVDGDEHGDDSKAT